MKGKRKIRRKPGVKRNMYFNSDTQDAILKYQESECDTEKKKNLRKRYSACF